MIEENNRKESAEGTNIMVVGRCDGWWVVGGVAMIILLQAAIHLQSEISVVYELRAPPLSPCY